MFTCLVMCLNQSDDEHWDEFVVGLLLVSDAVPAQGLADGAYTIGPRAVTIEAGRAYVTGTKVLCGSTSALSDCVARFKDATGELV